MFERLSKRIKNWWYGESKIKRELGFRANTDLNMKNSRDEQARWKRFEIANHIENLKDDKLGDKKFDIDESQAHYNLATTIKSLDKKRRATPNLQLAGWEPTEYENVVNNLQLVAHLLPDKRVTKLTEKGIEDARKVYLECEEEHALRLQVLKTLVTACEQYDKYTHDNPTSRSGQKGRDRLWFVKAVRSASIKTATEEIGKQDELERQLRAKEVEVSENDPRNAVFESSQNLALSNGMSSESTKTYGANFTILDNFGIVVPAPAEILENKPPVRNPRPTNRNGPKEAKKTTAKKQRQREKKPRKGISNPSFV